MRFMIGCAVLLAPFLAAAETGYVTDRLVLGLHQSPDTSDRAFRSLESGQEFEVLSRDRLYAHIQLPDGVQGYVKAAYIVYDKPAKLIVQETEARAQRLADELAEAREAFAEPAAAIEALRAESTSLEAELADTKARAAELEEQNERFRGRAAQYQYSLPLSWVLGAIVICLVGGFLAGLKWIDHTSRKRHGGIRIY